MDRPCSSWPLSSSTAFAPAVTDSMLTKPKPRERPVSSSFMTVTVTTVPNGSKSSVKSSSVAVKGRLPTNARYLARGSGDLPASIRAFIAAGYGTSSMSPGSVCSRTADWNHSCLQLEQRTCLPLPNESTSIGYVALHWPHVITVCPLGSAVATSWHSGGVDRRKPSPRLLPSVVCKGAVGTGLSALEKKRSASDPIAAYD
mmetsp:Transcript_60710/g.160659  ORF Transcript_60710/g.160659 Transcript_60710/m.160659 type:complete len:201 (-) Transcript_60710:19-621(-)